MFNSMLNIEKLSERHVHIYHIYLPIIVINIMLY